MKRHRNKRSRKNKFVPVAGTKPLSALTVAALGLQAAGLSLGLTDNADAQTRPDRASVRLSYSDYFDYQRYEDRMRVREPMLSFEAPLAERYLLQGSAILDSVSGASPLYLSSLSGASSQNIHDTRKAGDLALTRFSDRSSIGVTINGSTEDDYDSIGGGIESRIWTADKNTVFTMALGGSNDEISPSNNPLIEKSRRMFDAMLGLTQVLNRRSLIQMNLTYSNGDGYFSDPYKPFDNRPESRDLGAVLVRHVLYFEDCESALHTDYRFTDGSWGIQSHLFELAWYQPLGNVWTLRPHVRYYTQNEADFFSSVFPPDDADGALYSADQRLSAFGSLTTGMKFIYEVDSDLSLDASFDYMAQRPDYRLFGSGSSGIDPLYARLLTFGVTKKF